MPKMIPEPNIIGISFKKLFIKNENNPINSSPAVVLLVISIFKRLGLRHRERIYSQKMKINNAITNNSKEDVFAHRYIPLNNDMTPAIPMTTASESRNALDDSFVGVELIIRYIAGKNFHAM